DLGPLGEAEAHALEDADDALQREGERMEPAGLGTAAGHADVDPLRGEPLAVAPQLERVTPLGNAALGLVAHRLGGEPVPRLLTGGLACYRTYGTADGRYLTVGALEPKFFRRLCELLGRPDLGERQYEGDQEALASELAAIFATRSLAEWLRLFDEEDVCVGPVWTRAEAAQEFAAPTDSAPVAPLGEHTAAWRSALGFA
ncbi:MAG: CoA transferase, partial [Gaiellaceae bacterium]|nr:CoA transferase [Gaiellaceae bacterium]